MTFEELMQCTNPIYQDLHPSDKFDFLGSSFVAGLNCRTYLITAGHIIDGKPLDSLRIFHPKTGKPLPFNASYPTKSKGDRDELWIFEIDSRKLGSGGILTLRFIPLDRQSDQQLSSLPVSSHLMLKGYPIERGQVQEADWSLTNKSYLTDGRYVGADDRPGLHHARYFPGNHPIKDHDGMCGAPWIVRSEGDWEAMLAGVHVEGG
jgi:hypothetical protein